MRPLLKIEDTREAICPHLDTTDLPTAIVHLSGDPAARSLGYAPPGLAHLAGLALARYDASDPASEAIPAVTRGRSACTNLLP